MAAQNTLSTAYDSVSSLAWCILTLFVYQEAYAEA